MSKIVELRNAVQLERFGGKAVRLGEAQRAGLPGAQGIAVEVAAVEAVVRGDAMTIASVEAAFTSLGGGPVAVRSSAVGEDSVGVSFAGQHLTCMNVRSAEGVVEAIKLVSASGRESSALAYRRKHGLPSESRMAVVIQRLVCADVAGVLFTRDPVSGADQRVIEATWGLGESLVAGTVIPDRFHIDRTGEIVRRTIGSKDTAVRVLPDGGTITETLPSDVAEAACLDDAQLAALHQLASRCEDTFGKEQDIEWAFVGRDLFLLQARPITTG